MIVYEFKIKKWCPYQLWWDTNIQQISLLFRFAIHSWQYLNRSRVVRRHVHQFVSHTFEVQSRTELPHSRRDVTQEDDSSVLTEPMHGSSRLLAEYVEGREYGWSGDVVCPFVYVCVSKTKPDWAKFKRILSQWRYPRWKTTHFCQSDQNNFVCSVTRSEIVLIGYRVLIKAPANVYGDESCIY